MTQQTEVAVFGGGCFWCTEAVFENLQGVASVMPGYTGGARSNPTYQQICTGTTGHAEVIKVEFHPEKISYQDMLTVFFATHDPTTLNRQGNDAGTQYRSVVFYTTAEQKQQAESFIQELTRSGTKAVTEVKPLETFYEAEEYHRQYYRRNSEQPYCQFIIDPKLQKLNQKFRKLLSS